ncbi:hypothetical protein EZ449_03490 [Pedobacter frigidisoli]|uniref:Taurine catabolism dioxygenase TauD, TfdA family n=1 Tax=Pedobacter frigidisoli TaxID=2530455 RepID=A0A4R0P5D6_9SPHI|nr:hypothetical protein [Pedobacter frigidisoli]TCD12093.1 hypothetical protein EZ449_03490 [Pedobacter frigidisoli]
MSLFEETKIPAIHQNDPKVNQATWLTWSKEFLSLNKALRQQQLINGKVTSVKIRAYKAGNYSVNLKNFDKDLLNQLKLYAAELCRFNPNQELIFFTGLINRKISGNLLQFIFATLKEIIVAKHKDKFAALYIPLVSGKKISELPLHSDLFVTDILLNIFEKVKIDGSGHSTFLPLNFFLVQILPQLESMPLSISEKITEILTVVTKKDRYDELVNLLYNEKHPWNEELLTLMETHQQRILFTKGEGYLINDRNWLHGRAATNGGILKKRLHRLAYCSRD